MNNLHKSSKIIQLKTIIEDLGPKTRTYNVESAAKRLSEQLKLAQEEYKSLTGEYINEWMPIDEQSVPNGYKEITIDSLMDELQKLKDKKLDVLQYKGTLMCIKNGNQIILSTEKQM